MAGESALWTAIRKSKPPGVWHRIENAVGEGTPDVTFSIPGICSGWLELKSVAFPKRETSVVPVEFSSIEQVKWGIDWTVGGGGFYRLLVQDRISGLVYLMPASSLFRIYKGMPVKEMQAPEINKWIGTVRDLPQGINYCFRAEKHE